MSQEADSGAAGVLAGLGAYCIWGVTPIYWKELGGVPPLELIAHRALWSLLVAALLVTLVRAWPELLRVVRSHRHGLPMVASAVLLATNQLVFIYAVHTDRVIATSLGYYINPLVSVVLAVLVLRERMRRLQVVAFGVAAVGVLQLGFAVGELPWISLVLAFSFGIYGLVRKVAPVAPTVGFAVETLAIAPAALGYLALLAAEARNAVPLAQPALNALVAASGVVTAAPLVLFAFSAKRLRLATVGFFQYLAPSLALVIAVFLFDEPFTRAHALTFGCVWAALALYSFDSVRAMRGL